MRMRGNKNLVLLTYRCIATYMQSESGRLAIALTNQMKVLIELECVCA